MLRRALVAGCVVICLLTIPGITGLWIYLKSGDSELLVYDMACILLVTSGASYLRIKVQEREEPYTSISLQDTLLGMVAVFLFAWSLILEDAVKFVLLAPIRLYRWQSRVTEKIMGAIGW